MTGAAPHWLGSTLLALLLTACPSDEPSPGDPTASTGSGGSGGNGAGPGADDNLDDNGDSDPSGGAEETGFGMGDDTPLLTSIPEIKGDRVDPDTQIRLRGVVMSSPEAQIDAARSYFVQDIDAVDFAGLRVVVPPIFEIPDGLQRLDLQGTLSFGERRGWMLSVESTSEGADAPTVEPTVIELDQIAPGSTRRIALSDMLVTLPDPDGETLWVSATMNDAFELSETITVDLRPFAVPLDVPEVGTPVSELTGLVLLDNDQTVLLPRAASEVVL